MSEMERTVAKAICGAQGWDASEPSDLDRKMARAATEAVEQSLRALLKGEHSSLSLSFNELHAPNYQTAEEFLRDNPEDDADWSSAEEREKAIQTNSVWRLQWYPDTPVGFHAVQASSLGAIFAALGKEVS